MTRMGAGAWRSLCGAVVLAWCALSHAESMPLATVKHLDVQRYLGEWHQIAFYPNFFQRKCARGTRLSREDRTVIDDLLRASGYDPQRLVETPHSDAAQ